MPAAGRRPSLATRPAAVLAIVAAVALLAAASSTWVEVTAIDQVDAQSQGEILLERTTATSGAQVAGGLYVVGLAAIALAGPMLRWRATGWVLALDGLAGVALTVAALTRHVPADGRVTPAPAAAVALSLALVVIGVLGATSRTVRARAARPSRYTVEAVRGEADDDPADTTPADDWDLAVQDGQEERTGPEPTGRPPATEDTP